MSRSRPGVDTVDGRVVGCLRRGTTMDQLRAAAGADRGVAERIVRRLVHEGLVHRSGLGVQKSPYIYGLAEDCESSAIALAASETASRRRDRDDAIRRLRLQGTSMAEIGRRYGLSRERVRQICDVTRILDDRPEAEGAP